MAPSTVKTLADLPPVDLPQPTTTDCAITINEFYANKSVFITGGTGFLGTVLIEAILSTSPDVGTVYVLVRDKYGSNASARINRMLKKALFASHSPKVLEKVVPVVGELSEKHFGMTPDVYDDLLHKVNIIIHSAATIKFKSPLRTAITTNVTGTMQTIEFAKRLDRLAAYVYLSTAFCNSDQSGFIQETVYPSAQDPYEMMKLAADDSQWSGDVEPDAVVLCGDHPNTYTFTKQLAENLIQREMVGMPAGIVRPSVVYGTYEYPVAGWVGNANSGHLGLMAGYVKGLFRTISGNPTSVIDLIPCDYVISATMTIGWFVGTRPISTPELIHCTSGERNPITIEMFTNMLNDNAHVDPCDSIVWMPNVKIRNGWRYTVFFWLFHYFPAAIFYLPETIFSIGKPHHSALQYMRIFNKGTKAFEYFLNKEFRYSVSNSMRVMAALGEQDAQRYRFDAKECDWSLLMERCLLGLRRYYYRESYTTSNWHRIMYNVFKVIHYAGWLFNLALIYFALLPIASVEVSAALALLIWSFLVWL